MNTPATAYPVIAEPFHEGEKALQHETGAFGTLSVAGPRVIRSYMPEQHRSFFAQLPWLVAGSLDHQGLPQAHALAGPPGFVQSPDPRQLVVQARLPGLAAGDPVGLLGIEPHTRRRNRVNGVVSTVGDQGFRVQVSQSFGNCPKYIQAREATWAGPQPAGVVRESAALDDAARRIVAAADTFFIATAHPAAREGAAASHGVDVSHRGGRPGFVRLADDGSLQVPDYNGNHFFNTLGNLALNPHCALLFIDFETGDTLQLSASAQLVWDGPAVSAHPGALRLLVLGVQAVRYAAASLPLRWGPAALSPVLP